MLPPFIIEQIRKREEQERKQYEQPMLDLPLPAGPPKRRDDSREDNEGQRGVIIVELL